MSLLVALQRVWTGWLVPLLLVVSGPAAGQGIPGYPEHVTDYDPREVAILPRFCPHTQLFRDRVPGGNDPEEIRRWQTILGNVYKHMHHYCWGLMHLHRAKVLARDMQTRHFNFSSAIREFDYAIDRAPRDFLLLPEMLTKRGEALLGLRRTAAAVAEFEKAIALKPDYWPPYAQLSDIYKANRDLNKAREILRAGLAHSPQSKSLQRRLMELEQKSTTATGQQRAQ